MLEHTSSFAGLALSLDVFLLLEVTTLMARMAQGNILNKRAAPNAAEPCYSYFCFENWKPVVLPTKNLESGVCWRLEVAKVTAVGFEPTPLRTGA